MSTEYVGPDYEMAGKMDVFPLAMQQMTDREASKPRRPGDITVTGTIEYPSALEEPIRFTILKAAGETVVIFMQGEAVIEFRGSAIPVLLSILEANNV